MKTQLMGHLSECAGHHIAMAKCFGKAAKECDGAAAEAFKTAADLHLAHNEHYVNLAKGLREQFDLENDDSTGIQDDVLLDNEDTPKAGRARDLNKLVPTMVRGVMPTDVPGVRLVNRFGGPPVEQATKVDPEFADLVKLE